MRVAPTSVPLPRSGLGAPRDPLTLAFGGHRAPPPPVGSQFPRGGEGDGSAGTRCEHCRCRCRVPERTSPRPKTDRGPEQGTDQSLMPNQDSSELSVFGISAPASAGVIPSTFGAHLLLSVSVIGFSTCSGSGMDAIWLLQKFSASVSELNVSATGLVIVVVTSVSV